MFLVWLVLASYVSNLPTRIQPYFYSLWVIAFLILNARNTSRRTSDTTSTRVTHWQLFLLIALMVLMVILSVPWMWALKSGHCFDHLAYARDWVPHPLSADPDRRSWNGTMLVLLAAAPFPLAEEFAFRRWLFSPLQLQFGSRIALVATSILFALGHLRPSTFGTDLIFGFLMGFALLSTGTLVTPVLLHYATNATLGFLSVQPFGNSFKNAMATQWFSCRASLFVYVLSLVALSLLMLTTYRWRLKLASHSARLDRGISGENAAPP
jgi:membrane protease YdiL (CAAX protease family)